LFIFLVWRYTVYTGDQYICNVTSYYVLDMTSNYVLHRDGLARHPWSRTASFSCSFAVWK